MLDLKIELKVPDVALFKPEAAARIVGEEAVAAMEFGLITFKSEIQPRTPVDRGLLRAGVQTSLTGVSAAVTGSPAELTGRVFDPIGYAVPVELGARPHWPPRGPIEAWVKRKLHVPPNEVRGVAFVIARKIAMRGTSARRMFQEGFEAAKARVEARFSDVPRRIAARLLGR